MVGVFLFVRPTPTTNWLEKGVFAAGVGVCVVGVGVCGVGVGVCGVGVGVAVVGVGVAVVGVGVDVAVGCGLVRRCTEDLMKSTIWSTYGVFEFEFLLVEAVAGGVGGLKSFQSYFSLPTKSLRTIFRNISNAPSPPPPPPNNRALGFLRVTFPFEDNDFPVRFHDVGTCEVGDK